MKRKMLQLVAKKIVEPKILLENMHGKGNIFYQESPQGKITRIVYFSTSRVIDFTGEPSEALAAIARTGGCLVENIDFNEFRGTIEILQGKTSQN